MSSTTASFYVLDSNKNLVPAKFLLGLDGSFVVNPNTQLNTVSTKDNLYYDATGTLITNANPNNYLVSEPSTTGLLPDLNFRMLRTFIVDPRNQTVN